MQGINSSDDDQYYLGDIENQESSVLGDIWNKVTDFLGGTGGKVLLSALGLLSLGYNVKNLNRAEQLKEQEQNVERKKEEQQYIEQKQKRISDIAEELVNLQRSNPQKQKQSYLK